ncbi:ABC-type protease/lipase transport system, ATPase and permease components [Paramagnetospirillum magneticum AMB-1]|uniref:ABC-type protease/lipase transport system, ATPase and permease components n=2 Tax=Paramagnetospirillum magneticum TaxID=84159 RepID=Q2W4P5_PARM1|nr:ABC-type protease/lipase transport system, ATPase and permease components [Paramagnetospirillum magneticum AMB-1]
MLVFEGARRAARGAYAMSDPAAGQQSAADAPAFSIASLSTLKSNLFDLAMASLFLNILGLALPMALLQVYDRILPNKSVGTMVFLMGAVLGALLLESTLNFCRSWITGWVGAKFEHNAGCTALNHLVMAGVDEFEKDGSGAHLERMNSLATVREFYAGQAMLTLLDLPFAILYLSLVAMMGGILVFVPITILVLFCVTAIILGGKLRGALQKRMIADDRRFNFIIEVLGGIHSVKAFAMEAQMVRRYERLQETCAEGAYQVALNSSTAMGVSSFFSQATTVCVAMFGALVVLNGEMTTGGLAACSMLAGRAMAPIQKALGVWTRFQSFMLARHRLSELFKLKPESAKGLPKMTSPKGALELKDCTFRYGEKLPVIIQHASIDIREGECIAISGGNGSGKTTLLTLMQGAIKPTTGEVLVDGQPMTMFEPQSVRDHIAFLPQMGVLFQGTILQNITMFRKEFDDVAVETAALLGLDEVVATMALGYDTPVGDGAYDSLPRGIKQRIAIARALVNNPRVVLFDEANTAVDTTGDNFLRVWLERAKGKRTLVLVTPRPSLVKLADRVFDLKDGTLIAKAPREERPMTPDMPAGLLPQGGPA